MYAAAMAQKCGATVSVACKKKGAERFSLGRLVSALERQPSKTFRPLFLWGDKTVRW
jgi:hypothetical protein